ncbi:unnamed protein product [Aspergillus oryzae var. brunneus]|nr:unnamed protein product [Aspergillus oryzae var. brunneus]
MESASSSPSFKQPLAIIYALPGLSDNLSIRPRLLEPDIGLNQIDYLARQESKCILISNKRTMACFGLLNQALATVPCFASYTGRRPGSAIWLNKMSTELDSSVQPVTHKTSSFMELLVLRWVGAEWPSKKWTRTKDETL